jgi:exopolysaccharide biosynthesis polyprenyl glycosylphosphotransferase
MNGTERAALARSVELYDEMTSSVDERTLEILDHRRRTAVVRRRGWLVRRLLLAADLLGLALSFLIAELVFGSGPGPDRFSMAAEWALFVLTLPGWIVVAKIYGLYERDEERTDHSTTDEFVAVFHMITVCTGLFAFAAYLTGVAHPTVGKVAVFWAAATVLVTAGRAAARSLARGHVSYLQNTVIVGAGDVGQLIARKVQNHPEYGINVLGFVDDAPKERRDDLEEGVTVLGPVDRLPALVRLFDVDRVVIAFSNDRHERTLDLIRSLKDMDVQIDVVPRLFELVGSNFDLHTVEGIPLIGLPPPRLSRSSLLLKRALDLILSVAALTILTPVFALIAVLIRRDSTGPVFFRQVRMGLNGHTFRIWKFRTMTADADERKQDVAHLNQHLRAGGDPRMFKIPDDPRVTSVGRRLRRYSLDELPQLINVALGQMSLVGPRPLILDEDQHVSAWGRRRLNLKPGCTGPWQVLGRSRIPFEEMVKLDYLYVTGWSLFADLKLVARTIPVLARGSST